VGTELFYTNEVNKNSLFHEEYVASPLVISFRESPGV